MCAQVLDNSMAALRAQCDKDMQAQASLKAAAEAHARNVSDRDDCLREVAASCGMADLAGIAQLSPDDIARWAHIPWDSTMQGHCHRLIIVAWSCKSVRLCATGWYAGAQCLGAVSGDTAIDTMTTLQLYANMLCCAFLCAM